MAVLYTTVAKEAHAEQIIEKSKFIAHVKPVLTKEEAEEYIASIRAQYKDATHNVPAFVVGNKMQQAWGSDDGEPSGTSGTPIAQMIQKMGLTNLVVVVTRYFGGIKLGPGGLVRAYTSSAKMAIEKAGIFEVKEYIKRELVLPYSSFDKIKYLSENEPFSIISSTFEDSVKMTIEFEKDDQQNVEILLSELLKNY